MPSHNPSERAESWAASPSVRRVMQANKGRDTAPEMRLRRACHARGLRYRVSQPPEPGIRGTADMVFPRALVAVYVDGCFWHGCPLHYVPPKTNPQFWADKVSTNRARDSRTTDRLQSTGWLVVRMWEHEDVTPVADIIQAAVLSRRAGGGDQLRGRTPERRGGSACRGGATR